MTVRLGDPSGDSDINEEAQNTVYLGCPVGREVSNKNGLGSMGWL